MSVQGWLEYRKTFVGIPKDAGDDYLLTSEQLEGYTNQQGRKVNGLFDWLVEDSGILMVTHGVTISTLGEFKEFILAFI